MKTSAVGDLRAMLRAVRRDYYHTGAVAPSSRFLGRALAENLKGPRGPVKVLEVGPGTGAVTAQIVKLLGPQDQFDLVEINPDLCACLRQRFAFDQDSPGRARMRLFNSPVQDVPGEHLYDHLVCGLPFNNFPPQVAEEIFATFRRLLKPGGTLAFFEYAGIRALKSAFVGADERRRLRSIADLLGREVKAGQFRRRLVWANLPPAYARHLRLHGPARP